MDPWPWIDRRTLLKQAGAAALWLLWPVKLLARTVTRRTRPSDAAWPSEAAWKQLSDAVGGNLIKIKSPLAEWQAGAAGCGELFAKDLRNPYYIGDDPALTQTLGWVDAWTSAPSAYAVAARNAEDMAAAVRFARAHNLRVAVRGGGHSYCGTSNAPDSLLLWTRHINDITIHDRFVPRGCSSQPVPAVTVGAGVIWGHAYDAAVRQAGRYVQGGGCATVNVAGLIQSGGFGSFSKHYGMAAAGLLEAEVVTADGTIRTVNACTDPDLFWALKGGGGGSFGVVTRLTLHLRDLPESFGAFLFTIKASSDADFRRLVGHFVEFYRDHLFNQHWGEQAEIRGDNSLNITMVCHGLTEAQIKQTWQPFVDWVAQSPATFQMKAQPIIIAVPAQHWWDAEYMNGRFPGVFLPDTRPGANPRDAWWANDSGQVGQFMYGYESLWLPQSLLEGHSRDRLVNALFAASRHRGVALHFNKGLAGAPPEAIAAAKEVATNPAVLTAFALAISGGAQEPAYPGVAGHEPDQAAGRKIAGLIHRAMDELRALVPENGSYVSESNYFEKRWQRSHWGANYRRLAAIKRKYDPDGLFCVHHGVGSEDWSADGFTRL
jgi:FAD/FMN-containing dehydrogenase